MRKDLFDRETTRNSTPMITRLEIDGFKTFHNFDLHLAPFQVIIGMNGVGKSNLFDALRLLSRLADTDLRTAFQDLRGEAGELFLHDSTHTTTMYRNHPQDSP